DDGIRRPLVIGVQPSALPISTPSTRSEFAADALAVLDATATDRAVVVALSMGAQRALLLAAEHPERVEGVVFIGPAVPLPPVSRSEGGRVGEGRPHAGSAADG